MGKIIFLGTGGARIVVFKQIRASGGIWFSSEKTNFLLDPGPGSLIQCLKYKLDPTKLDGIILSHKHLDHSADLNTLVEAMTEGGFKKRGKVFLPRDALEERVLLEYLRNYPEEVTVIEEGEIYRIGEVSFSSPRAHVHGNALTYGFNFNFSKKKVSYLCDTRYFPQLPSLYEGEILIINVVRLKESPHLDHLSLPQAEKIIKEKKPEVAILTHFGMTILRQNPWKLASELEKRVGVKVVVAKDGMEWEF